MGLMHKKIGDMIFDLWAPYKSANNRYLRKIPSCYLERVTRISESVTNAIDVNSIRFNENQKKILILRGSNDLLETGLYVEKTLRNKVHGWNQFDLNF